jgi:hypothetical protein
MDYYYAELDDPEEGGQVKVKEEARGHQKKKEESEVEEQPIDWWDKIRRFARVMLLISAASLVWLILWYIFFVFASEQHGEVIFVKPIKCAVGTSVYLLVILANDTIRVCDHVVRKVWRNRASLAKILGGIIVITIGLIGIILYSTY